MKKQFIIVLMLLLLCSCSNAAVPDESKTNHSKVEESTISDSSDIMSTPDAAQEINEKIFQDAMEKWKNLGGSYAFKNIETLDIKTMVSIYSTHLLYTGEYSKRSSESGEVSPWIGTHEINDFAQEYFGISIDGLENNLSPNKYGENGYCFDNKAQALNNDAKYKMIETEINSDGTFRMNLEIKFNLQNLVPEEEENVTRIVNITFKYENDTIHFITASYIQNGREL